MYKNVLNGEVWIQKLNRKRRYDENLAGHLCRYILDVKHSLMHWVGDGMQSPGRPLFWEILDPPL